MKNQEGFLLSMFRNALSDYKIPFEFMPLHKKVQFFKHYLLISLMFIAGFKMCYNCSFVLVFNTLIL